MPTTLIPATDIEDRLQLQPSDSSVISVIDGPSRRRVRLLSPQLGTYSSAREFETDWPADMLYALADLKGKWFYDSYQRFEHPNYLQKHIDSVLDLYKIDLRDAPVLDFGCGFGASSYCMIKRGATRIFAADLEEANTDFATRFFDRTRLSQFVEFRCGDVVPTLEPHSYAVIWLQAVMEHLLPEERRSYLRQFWRALRPGGALIITETPNRVWPVEGHTTGGTWWIPWMKPQRVFRKMRRQQRYQSHTDEQFYRCGIIGSSYREILECLGHPRDCREASLGVTGYTKYLYSRATCRSVARRIPVSAISLTEPLVRFVLRRPISAFMPFLNHLAFVKM